MLHSLSTPIFTFSCEPEIFERDIAYPTNTILHVHINSDGYCANADLDIDIKCFARFASDLQQMYDKLHGTAIIEEPYGNQSFIQFTADRCGHILVNGVIDSNGRNGYCQKLTFENCFDQTYLAAFASSLVDAYGKYLKPRVHT